MLVSHGDGSDVVAAALKRPAHPAAVRIVAAGLGAQRAAAALDKERAQVAVAMLADAEQALECSNHLRATLHERGLICATGAACSKN